MPGIAKIQKEDIVNAGFKIAKSKGMEGINARDIAKMLNCSVQPIFYQFENMEEVNKAIYDKIYKLYQEYMLSGKGKEKEYKQMGLSYIKYAKDYPEFFKIIFMQRTSLNAENFIMADKIGDDVIKAGQKLTGLSFEEQKEFHVKVWMLTHGIACLVATGTIDITEKEIEEILESTVREMATGYVVEKNKKLGGSK